MNRELKRRTRSVNSLGEKTLQTLLAFTALRLELNGSRTPVNASCLNNLMYIKQNRLESVIETWVHSISLTGHGKMSATGSYIKKGVPKASNFEGEVNHEPMSPIVDHFLRKAIALRTYTACDRLKGDTL